ncbi:hypothetical protein [Arenimonas sp.]|uniref:hypothetical protein n=1 Tax=Arenimonas sp. TaxID=1872635 RepID=UPI0039E3ABC2
MQVPAYWAEASARHREGRKQITVRRFGWSDESEQAAQAHADERAQEALILIMTGAPLVRREPKVPYNGADGVPIREEILERHGEVVITRNLYGAPCLNTPDALFADIDFQVEPASSWLLVLVIVLGLTGFVTGHWLAGWGLAILLVFVGVIVAIPLARLFLGARTKAAGGPEKQAVARIERFLQSHPDWLLRLYRTPAGMRVLAMHRRFDPSESVVAEFFKAVSADPEYVRMCQHQQCFRARLGPKPWRIGMPGHIKPRPGIWPVRPERRAERDRWVADYETRARDYAACASAGELGSGKTDPAVDAVRELHDRLCRAESDLPLA